MTLSQLNEHLEKVEKYIEAQEIAQRLRDSVGLKAQDISGMPRGSGAGDMVGAVVAEIISLEEQAEELGKAAREDQPPIEAWINSLDDLYAQTILRLRFIHGMRWQAVADTIGGGNTAQSVKVAAYRSIS